jgi:hypothetical protein
MTTKAKRDRSLAARFRRLEREAGELPGERRAEILAAAVEGGAFVQTKSVTRDLISAIDELATLRRVLNAAFDWQESGDAEITVEELIGVWARLCALEPVTLQRARAGCRVFHRFTDATRLYADIRAYVAGTGGIEGDFGRWLEADTAKLLDLVWRLEAIEAMVDPVYSEHAGQREAVMGIEALAIPKVTRRSELLPAAARWMQQIAASGAQVDRAAAERGIGPGSHPPKRPPPSGAVESLLLNAMSQQPMQATALCAKAKVKHNSNAKQALVTLVKTGRCGLRRGRGGGYFVL